ncbi:MAG: alpha-L-fucosidase [Prevotella sp.]
MKNLFTPSVFKTVQKLILTSLLLGNVSFQTEAQDTSSEHASETSSYYKADWHSLQQYKEPEWWRNMKFGIYFHWGPYSVPAEQTEWYSHYMYQKDHPLYKYHRQHFGPQDKFGYKDFIPLFTAKKFDADKWAALFKEAGAQFAGPVAEHADGFAMWDSKLTHWDAMEMGPKQDIVAAMQKAIRKQDIKFIIIFHRHWLYAWYPTWDKTSDCFNPKYADLYGPKTPKGTFVGANKPTVPLPDAKFNQAWLDRLNELMDNYQPDIIWFDNKMDIIGEPYRQQFLANYYNKAKTWKKEVVCTYKAHDLPVGTAVLDLERSRMKDKKDFPWLTDDSIDWGAWCNVSDPHYKTTNRLIDFLVDVVSKNGAVLLNVTPTAEGVMPQPVQKRLRQMGAWLKINGKAIYNTRPWKIYGEGVQKIVEGHLSEKNNTDATAAEIRFTTCAGHLYAFVLDWPKNNTVLIHSLHKGNTLMKQAIKSATLLGSNEKVTCQQTDKGLSLKLNKKPSLSYAYCFELK